MGKAAIIKFGNLSHSNEHIVHQLKENFPDIEIEVYDLFEDIISKFNPLAILASFFHYGFGILSGKRSIYTALLRTPYFFRTVRKKILKRLSQKNYNFTFQTQSLFDASLPGIPHFIYTDHTHLANLQYPGFNKRNLFSEKWIACEKTIYKNATCVFTFSNHISRSLVEDYLIPEQKGILARCGPNVRVEKDETVDSEKYSKKTILFAGIDWKRKGGPTLVEAFKKIQLDIPDAKLIIVGCTPDITLDGCLIVGKVTLSELKKYYQLSSVFCLPTTLEPFGLVFLEAMAHKLPLVATNIGAMPDLIQNDYNGYMVNANDPIDLAEKLKLLISSPGKCAEFGMRGYKLVWEEYTWEKTGNIFFKTINRYLKNNSKD